MDNNLVERHLDNWASWHRNSSVNLGYPKRAMLAVGGGQSVEGVFEEMCSDVDRFAAEIMEALVNDLPTNQSSSIYHHWLGCSIKVRNQEQSLSDAYDTLSEKISKRGLA